MDEMKCKLCGNKHIATAKPIGSDPNILVVRWLHDAKDNTERFCPLYQHTTRDGMVYRHTSADKESK